MLIGVFGSLIGVVVGARLNANEAARADARRAREEAERRATEFKAAARLVLAELGAAAVAVEAAADQLTLRPFHMLPSTAWATHGVVRCS